MSEATRLVEFEKHAKSMIALHIPAGVHELVRGKASKADCTQSLALAYLICRGAEVDPTRYGIIGVDTPSADRLTVSASNLAEASVKLKAFANPTRAAIVMALEEEPKTVGQICRAVGKPQYNVSLHIGTLRRTGLIEGRRSGKNVIYELTELGRKLAAAGESLAATDLSHAEFGIPSGAANQA